MMDLSSFNEILGFYDIYSLNDLIPTINISII
jgi:hypothetical protein